MENLLFEDFVENTETEENVDLSQVEEINVEQGFEEATHVRCDNTLQMYFREIARIPLLNKEEEISLFNIIEKGKEAKARITLIETNDDDTTPIQEYQELLKVVEEANVAREKVANANLRLAVAIAKNYRNTPLSFQDLIQNGSMGILKAIDKFDISKGYKFSTYATWWIKQSITRSISNEARTIRVPEYLVDKIAKVNNGKKYLSNLLNREPSLQEICEYVEMSEKQVLYLQNLQMSPTSLDKVVKGKEEDKQVLGDFIADPSKNGLDYSKNRELDETIEELLSTLSEREAYVIKNYIGLNGLKPLTFEEIGFNLGVTKQRIFQIYFKAIRKMQNPIRSKKLFAYWNEIH